MVACGAFGALTVGNVKWVWWFFGMCWFLHIIFALGKSWAEAAKSRGGESGAVYSKLAGLTVIVWFCYPIVWVFAEGFGNFSVTFEVPPPREHAKCGTHGSAHCLREIPAPPRLGADDTAP
jgi:bacteriorhodopsin